MKKYILFCSVVLTGLAFVSCDEDFDDWSSAQTNPQEEAVSIPGFTASAVEAIDLADVADDEDVQVLVLSETTLPDGATIENVQLKITPADDETAEAQTVDANTDGTVSKAALQAAVENAFGKRPVEREFSAHVYANMVIDGEAYLVDAGVITLIITPEAPFIASAYYLVGDMCGWDEASMIQFSHSDEDVYDDPVFTVTFSTTGGQYWKIIPQTNIDSGDFWHEGSDGVVGVAVDGDTSLSGTLVAIEGVNAGEIADAGTYRMTINMMDYSYEISALASEFYITGNPNGWASDASGLFYPEGDNVYSYTGQYNASWDAKFWAASDLGNWDYIYGCDVSKDNVGDWSGSIVYSNGDQGLIGCITSPSAGLYTLYINMGTMTYWWEEADQSVASYSLVSITGDFNGWGDYIDMTEIGSHNWYVEANIPSDGGLKFLVDHSWDVNWGADFTVTSEEYYAVGVQNGSNITVPAGNYRIYLNDITGKFMFVAE